MTEVSVNIHGRQYGITCDEGQESRVQQLGAYVDDKVRDMAAAGAASNDTQLLVLASILMADELFELRDQVQNAKPAYTQQMSPVEHEDKITETIDEIAARINGIADQLLSA